LVLSVDIKTNPKFNTLPVGISVVNLIVQLVSNCTIKKLLHVASRLTRVTSQTSRWHLVCGQFELPVGTNSDIWSNILVIYLPDLPRILPVKWKLTSVRLTLNWKTISQRYSLLSASRSGSTTMETSHNAINVTGWDTRNLNVHLNHQSRGPNTFKNSATQRSSPQTCLVAGSTALPSTKGFLQRRKIQHQQERLSQNLPRERHHHPRVRDKRIINSRSQKETIAAARMVTTLPRGHHNPDLSRNKGMQSQTDSSRTTQTRWKNQSGKQSTMAKTKDKRRTGKSTWITANPPSSRAVGADSNDSSTVLWWNCGGGLRSKIDYIKYTILTIKPAILFVSEAEIKINDDLGSISIENYDILLSNTIDLGKARVAAYVHNDLNYKRLKNAENEKAEIISLMVGEDIFVGIYRPFKPTVDETIVENFDRLLNALKKVEHPNRHLYIGGDFNVNWLDHTPTTFKEKLLDLSIELNISQLINTVTRQRAVNSAQGWRLEESCLDHVFSNDVDCHLEVLTGQPSDHHMIKLLLPCSRKAIKKKTMFRDWKDYKKEDLIANIRLIKENYQDWLNNGPFSLLDRVVIILLTIYDELVPLRVAKLTDTQTLNSKIEALRKRRDRFLKKFKKFGDPEHAEKANTFTKTLKKVIKKEQRRTTKVKATTGNSKCFWSAVSKLQGKFRKKIPGLTIEGKFTEDEKEMTDAFATGFLGKIADLTQSQPKIEKIRLTDERMEDFNIEELEKAIKKIKSKKSCGLDALPTCIMKDAFSEFGAQYLEIFNDILKNGLPQTWKIAVVTPLHKKGQADIVGNFRPISNLSSIGKFFEKCVLERLNKYEDLFGNNQHGFRNGHSTQSAMLEIQSHLSKGMDKDLFTCIYSADMSAAFDLLRPDKFNELLSENLEPGLMWTLLDFLSDRKFLVRLGSTDSKIVDLDRGCVQGSVLGPALFSAYCRNLVNVLKDAMVTSYADDTYVIITADTMDELIQKTTNTMHIHFEYLDSLGMVVNQAKTEIMIMKNKKDIIPSHIKLSNVDIEIKQSLKVLGIQFDFDLSWNTHLQNITKKAQKMISGLKVIRGYLGQDDFLKVVTSQYFGAINYAMPVWYEVSSAKHKAKMDVLHYKALRVVIGDWQRLFPREMLDTLGRAKPAKFAQYSTASILIKSYTSGKPKRLAEMIRENEYKISRTNTIRFFDSSRKRIGYQAIGNRIGNTALLLDDEWTKMTNKDSTRKYLKKTFFT